MINFCTLFDSYYIHKGIALYLSLENVCSDFHLYVMAFDRDCYDKLTSIGFTKMTVEYLEDFETPELLSVKSSRTKAEYCWTCGPSVIGYFLTKYELDSITYLDSDLFFFSNPQIIFDEIGDRSVAITEQGISKQNAQNYGRFCVQFMFFKKNESGLKTLYWWRDACIKWCFQRLENGLYGDQKYLDDFPNICNDLCIITNKGAGVAPWNMNRYNYQDGDILYDGFKYPIVFFHMHGLKSYLKKDVLLQSSNNYIITAFNKELFFNPYANLTMFLLNTYFDKRIFTYKVKGMSLYKRLEYAIRNRLRNNMIVKFIYYDILKISYSGHGTKIS